MKSASKEETFAMKRIVQIVEDMRPLLNDRIKAITPDGYVLGDCLNEISDIATACAGIESPRLQEEVANGSDAGTIEQQDQDTDGTEPQPEATGGASRKGSARERHAQALATGKLTV